MLNFKKLISLFLAVLMLCSALTSLFVVTASAEEAPAATESATETVNYEEEDAEERTLRYHSTVFANPEEKLATMKKMSEKGNYIIYADQASGEVAIKDKATGQILFTNPYDIGTSNATENVKNRLMSQIIVQFKEVESDNKRTYGSFEYAAAKDQIKVKNIKGGIRVEYTIGREEARRLVPRQIERSRFEELIQAPMEEYYGITREEAEALANAYDDPRFAIGFYLRKQLSYFILHDLDTCESDRLKQDKLDAFPILSKMDIYALEPTASTNEIEKLEEVIKTACPNYSYEEMDYDHQLTEFTSEEENPPLFKMALEYTIDETGVSVRLPANGIRFNESKFELLSLNLLPYLGAGNNAYDGYAFFPDGSGALFAFEDMKEINNETITAKIYGEDYAYHKLDMEYQQVVRYPVFGIVENTRYYDFLLVDDETGEEKTVTLSGVIYDALMKAVEEGTTANSELYKKYGYLLTDGDMTERVVKNGFAAIMEEGDALTSLSYIHEGTQADYDTISMICNPRPRDEYNLADAISVGDNKTVSVVSERKYVGNYKVRLTMLSDETLASEAVEAGTLKADGWYEASWLGMGVAYRDYLVKKGYLTAPDSTVSNSDIPLYIESFGAMETIEKILSVPVEVKRPLTSAQDVITMYDTLSKEGVSNINFKLTGYANGGMYATVPYGLKWEKAVSKDMTMQELFTEAATKTESGNGTLKLYPDFDFSYINTLEMFDGFSMRKHAVRTIDDRYSYKREYMATRQKYMGYFYLAVSPAYFSRFYKKFMTEYLTYEDVTGISVGTLGTALNSDFDEDEPYNREDAKSFVTKALEFISGGENKTLEVMVDGGNAYTWQYVDHILGASLDSSRYIVASYSVPFLGVVLHGHMNFAGAPLNMEGDVNYAKLKAIENGASIYFTLSYQNTQNLKEDYYLSKYYSVRYDIWFDDVVEIYNELNAQLRDVQNMPIIDHEFLTGMRVPDTDELDRDLKEEYDYVMNFQGNQQLFLDQMKAESVADARDQIHNLASNIKSRLENAISRFNGNSGATVLMTNGNKSFVVEFQEYTQAQYAYDEVNEQYQNGKVDEKKLTEATEALEKAKNGLMTSVRGIAKALVAVQVYTDEIEELMEAAKVGAELIDKTAGRPQSIVDEVADLIKEAEEIRDQLMGITFDYSTGNLEVNTFLYLHYATFLTNATGDINHSGEAVIGSIESIYKLFSEEKYGLYYNEIELLKYIEANRDLSDRELIEKYGLSESAPSLDGLIKYIGELLGDSYEFDPALVADGSVGDSLGDYFKNKFMSNVKENNKNLGKNDNVEFFLKYFNLDPDREHPTRPGVYINNNINILAIIKAVQNKLDVLVGKKDSILVNVTDGNYNLEDVYTEDQMNALVAEIVQIFEKNDRDNKDAANPIKYLTPETMEADIRNYIKSYYYLKVMEYILPQDTKNIRLPVLTVESKTDTSMDTILNMVLKNVGAPSGTALYTEYTNRYVSNQARVEKILKAINEKIKPYYGDQYDALWATYMSAFANKLLSNIKTAPVLDAKQTADRTAIRDAAKELMADKLSSVKDFKGLDALVNEVVKLHDGKEMKDDYDVKDRSTAYVYHCYYQHLADTLETESFYYDTTLATVDAAVREKVEEKKVIILDKLGNDFTYFEYFEAVVAVLADKDDSADDFADRLAADVPYTPAKKGTIANDILQHYCYSLFNCVEGMSIGTFKSYELTVETGDADNARNNIEKYFASEYMADLLKKAKDAAKGGTPNYALTAFLTEAELTTIVDTIIERQLIKLDYVSANPDYDVLRPQVTNLIKYCFYSEALEQMAADEPVDFNVSEVYGSSLEQSAADLKKIVEFYTLNFSSITEEEFNKLFDSKDIDLDGTDDDEFSRYLSDDGRIVSVTYGQKQANGTYAKYKTFVLNYNNFSVNVEYEGVTYTIPAYGYVVVMHTNS